MFLNQSQLSSLSSLHSREVYTASQNPQESHSTWRGLFTAAKHSLGLAQES